MSYDLATKQWSARQRFPRRGLATCRGHKRERVKKSLEDGENDVFVTQMSQFCDRTVTIL